LFNIVKNMNEINVSYLRDREVGILTKLSRTTRWKLEKDGNFPKRRRLGKKAVRWLLSEVEEWMKTRECASQG
jgi:prophage regulatory protein